MVGWFALICTARWMNVIQSACQNLFCNADVLVRSGVHFMVQIEDEALLEIV